MTNKDTNNNTNKYENLVIYCNSKEEWDWVFEHLPEGYSDSYGRQISYNLIRGYCIRLHDNIVDFDGFDYYNKNYNNKTGLVKAIISFEEYKDMFLQDQQEEANQYHAQPSKPNTKTLELLSKNISTFTKATKLAGIDEKELDSYSKLLIQLSAGGVELSWIFYPNLD